VSVVYFTISLVCQTTTLNGKMNDELERIWKWSWPNIDNTWSLCVEDMRKITKNLRITGISVEDLFILRIRV
jgi:hypothetical protein